MKRVWKFDAPWPLRIDVVNCQKCGREIAATEPCFCVSPDGFGPAWLCMDCACAEDHLKMLEVNP